MISSKKLAVICSSVFLLVVFAFLGWQLSSKPRVLIIHSYHANMPWVQSINRGIKRNFADKPYVHLRYFYMDTKRKRTRGYLNRISRAVQSTIHSWKPDVIIAFDHAAHSLLRQTMPEDQGIRVIMGGVTNHTFWHQVQSHRNITGISEEIPVGAIREILSLIFRHKRRIYYLSDDSETARALSDTLHQQDWGSYDVVANKKVSTLNQWKHAIESAQQDADIILLSTYHQIYDDKRQVPPAELIHWTHEHSHIPVVGVYESFMLDGGMMAIAISGIEQGYTTSWLALQVIEKKLDISHLPMLHGRTFALFIDKLALSAHFPDAKIPNIIDAFTRSSSKLDDTTIKELHLASR